MTNPLKVVLEAAVEHAARLFATAAGVESMVGPDAGSPLRERAEEILYAIGEVSA